MNKQVGSNVSGDGDVLVILSGDRAAESIEQVCAGCKVQQLASTRVGVVESSQGQLSDLKSLPGVTVVTGGGDLPPGAMEGLDEGESLFVNAWLSRKRDQPPKQRPGEGLPWDAPGFLPPDPPPDKPEPSDDQKEQERRN